jgi:folate-dependent phosphoribosylglycinamide formyltransferase PurN
MLSIHRPLRVAVLCSHRAPGLLYLLNRSPDRGVAYEIVCCVTSERTFAEEVRVERRGIPTIAHPIAEFCEERGVPIFQNLDARAAYDAETLKLIDPYLPELLFLDGYLYIVTTPLLNKFQNRILNIHYSDLTFRTSDGAPGFPGIRAVHDGLAAGCSETRATVHLVNAVPDAGPPIVLSWPFPVSPLVEEVRKLNADDVFEAYVFAHQHWMMRTASGPLMAAALRLVANGTVDLDGLAAADAQRSTPWLLERHGFLMAPEVASL